MLPQVQGLAARKLAQLGWDRPSKLIILEIQVCTPRELAKLGWNRPAKLIVVESQDLAACEFTQLGWNRPTKLIEGKIQVCAAGELAQLGWNRPTKLIVAALHSYDHFQEWVACDAIPRAMVRARDVPRVGPPCTVGALIQLKKYFPLSLILTTPTCRCCQGPCVAARCARCCEASVAYWLTARATCQCGSAVAFGPMGRGSRRVASSIATSAAACPTTCRAEHMQVLVHPMNVVLCVAIVALNILRALRRLVRTAWTSACVAVCTL